MIGIHFTYHPSKWLQASDRLPLTLLWGIPRRIPDEYADGVQYLLRVQTQSRHGAQQAKVAANGLPLALLFRIGLGPSNLISPGELLESNRSHHPLETTLR